MCFCLEHGDIWRLKLIERWKLLGRYPLSELREISKCRNYEVKAIFTWNNGVWSILYYTWILRFKPR